MYPMLREDISFMIRKSKNSDKLRYYIKNGDEDEFEISRILYIMLFAKLTEQNRWSCRTEGKKLSLN